MKECITCRRCYPDTINHCPKDGGALEFSIIGDTTLDGRYQLEQLIGKGGMGAVYKAHHTFLKTHHAIKIILPDLVGNDPSLATRFRQEAMAAAAIHHPNIINVTDFGVVRGTTPFLVMEFVKGRSLQDIITAEGRIAPTRAFEIISPVAEGLAAAHREGIIHRDLKPLNILVKEGVTFNEGVKILDFGLAKIKSGELLGSFVAAQTTGMMGSPLYMSPEQWSDDELDSRADIYSLGVILFQMLAGEVPFKGSSIPSIMNKHLNQSPSTFAAIGVDVPPAIEVVVQHALEKDRTRRPESADAFIREFRTALASVTDGVTTPNVQTPKTTDATRVSTAAPIPAANFDAPRSNVTFVGDTKADANGATTQHRGAGRTEDLRGEPRPDISARETVVGYAKDATSGADNATHALGEESLLRASDPFGSMNVEETPFKTQISIPQMPSTPVASPASSNRTLILIAASILGVAVLAGGIGWYLLRPTNGAMNNNTQSVTNTSVPPKTQDIKPDLVSIPGGSFKVGRDDVPAQTAAAIVQTPARLVNIKPFAMDRTEVMNAEYALFVQQTGHEPPSDWNGKMPPSGREKYPVANVDLSDAEAFVAWRSKRDNVKYRLPTEEEWEYAARGGDKDYLYPWGNQWLDGFANVGNGDDAKDAPKPVGSYTQGKSPFGLLDMIGNVWEWTSSKASVYPGNNRIKLPKDQTDWMVRRGGGYTYVGNRQSAEIAATFRDFVPASTKTSTLGFRLVREEN
ncbi:MAG: hypothetical protein NVSMB56_15740 [Pyrinomonadaceae bacterium]